MFLDLMISAIMYTQNQLAWTFFINIIILYVFELNIDANTFAISFIEPEGRTRNLGSAKCDVK